MRTVNLLCPEKSDLGFEKIKFPDGQPHLKFDMAQIAALPKNEPLRILTRMASADDLLWLLFAHNTLCYQEFTHIELHLTYLLAARMDRVMNDGEPFSLKVIAGIINQAGFKKICIFDNHSEVSTALIDRSYTVTNHRFVQDSIAHYFQHHPSHPWCIVSPDAGALKKIHKLARFLPAEEVVECMKERDLSTGKLLTFKTTETDLQQKTCFIIDDICDGGGTFAGTAQVLRNKNAGAIVLIVSHGIFSKGYDIAGIDAIYSTDSYRPIEEGKGRVCFPADRYF